FKELGPDVIQRAMDECTLVSDMDLYAKHIRALEAKGVKVKKDHSADPPETQIRTSEIVYRAYSEPARAVSESEAD
ncbi:MAG: hypothetical protein ACREEP_05260, partial [Dongiaceae bacterium]